jgi:hypothetical protein
MPRPDTTTSLLTGYGWTEEGMVLRLATWPEGEPAEDRRLIGRLRFRLVGQTRCGGYFDFATSTKMACPEKATPLKKAQCEACVAREGFAVWMRCNGRDIPPLLPAVRAYVESPHYLYLANFGDDQVKVGMASSVRKAERLLDQGPLAAIYVAYGSGVAIRQLEVEMSSLGLIEFVRRSRKLKLLSEGCALGDAQALLHRTLGEIRGKLSDEHHGLLLPEPHPFLAPAFAAKARSYSRLEHLEPAVGQIIEGDVLAGSGSVVIVDEGGLPTAIDMGELVGQVIEFDPPGQVERAAKQMGLF